MQFPIKAGRITFVQNANFDRVELSFLALNSKKADATRDDSRYESGELSKFRHNVIISHFSPIAMYVRVKRIGSKRYAYLVEGVREKERVRQKTLCYLGPVAKIGFGIPDEARRKVERRFPVNWERIENSIRKIPLTLEEISQLRRENFAPLVRTRSGPRRPRAKGELSALSKLAAISFAERFERIKDREYRMR